MRCAGLLAFAYAALEHAALSASHHIGLRKSPQQVSADSMESLERAQQGQIDAIEKAFPRAFA
jgi:hypothetical protein